MGERPTIAFRVDQEQKAEWEGYADEHDEYDSLSHLIRVAVAHEMSDHYGPNEGGSGPSSEQTGELVTAMNRIEGRLEDLEDSVASATDAMYSAGAGSDDFSTTVFSELPVGEENALSAGEIAQRLAVETAEVRGALERLRNQTNAVRRLEEQVTGRSEPVYYRVD